MRRIAAKKGNLRIILEALRDGKILICPTDTVYGLLCDAMNKKAVEKIFKIKKREKSKPLAVFVKNIISAKKIAYIDRKQEKFLKKAWPGKTTFILKFKAKSPVDDGPLPKLSGLVIGKNGTIGIRIPDYKLLNLILEKFKKPIAQTSANISGLPATTKIKEVLKQFAKQKARSDLAIINAGDLLENKPSKVIDLINNNILRK